MRRLGLVLASLLVLAPSAHAATDPERESDAQTAAVFFVNQSENDVKQTVKQGYRLTDIEVSSTSPWRFTTTYVHNSGAYKRDWGWWFDKSPQEAGDLLKKYRDRIIDLETNRVGGKTVVSMVVVKNKGASDKGWWWYVDRTPGEIKTLIDRNKMRLTDLNAYEIGKKTYFSAVGISNKGEDSTAWWWWNGVSAADLNSNVKSKGARIIDIERQPNGTYAGIAVKDPGGRIYDIWRTKGQSPEAIGRLAANQGSRVFELETAPGGYAALLVGNTNAETARIRRLINASPFGDARLAGAYAKPVEGGPATTALAADVPFQPASVMKLLSFTYTLFLYDRGLLKDDSGAVAVDLSKVTLKFKRPPPAAGDTTPQMDLGCPANNSTDKSFTDMLRNSLQRAMWQSLNRAHETLLDYYTPEAMTKFAQTNLGMPNTQLYHGCKTGTEDQPWRRNRTTLVEIGRLLELVEKGDVYDDNLPDRGGVETIQADDEFDNLIAHWKGASDVAAFRAVVADEAAKLGKSGVVDAFMGSYDMIGKPGGIDDPDPANAGRWLAGRAVATMAEIPFKDGAEIDTESYVAGFYANDVPGPCTEGSPAKAADRTKECSDYLAGMTDIFFRLNAELYRPFIRKALKTW